MQKTGIIYRQNIICFWSTLNGKANYKICGRWGWQQLEKVVKANKTYDMNRKFIIDKEINLNESDFLQTKHYADNLTRVIKNTEADKVFTIGLFGSWGTGKSSIIKTSKKEIEALNDVKVKFITYDAWQYANDSFRRMFLRQIRKDLCFDETQIMTRFYQNESADIDNKFNLSTTKVAWVLAAICLATILIWILPIDYTTKMPLYSIFAIAGLFITIISGTFHQLKVSITKPLFFAPEQFEDCFKQMVSFSLKKYSWVSEKIYVVCGVKATRNLDKLVIVIDNIDRCNNDVAYSLLTDIKTFLGSDSYSIVFVIPVDDEALRKHLFKVNNHTDEDISLKDKEEFLRKFFNVTIRIKPYQEADMFSFVKKMNEKFSLNFNNSTLMLASKEYSTNPRRVIQLFNNLSSELSNYPAEFSKQNESLICVILILKEEFGNYYKEILRSPKKLIERDASSTPADKIDSIKRFLSIVQNVVRRADKDILNEILTNTKNIFSNLSGDIKDAITTYDTDKIIEFYKNDPEDVTDYIVSQARTQSNNGLLENLTTYFDIVAKIDKEVKIDFDNNSRFNEVFNNQILFILHHSQDYDNLCLYALSQEEQGSNEIKKTATDIILSSNSSNQFWNPLFSSILKYFTDEETSRKLSSEYFKNYKEVSYKVEQLVSEQYNYLIDDEFVSDWISRIEMPSITSPIQNRLFKIFTEKQNISIENYKALFKKLTQLIEEDIVNKPHEVLVDYIDSINPLLELIPNNKLLNDNGEILHFCQTILGSRLKPNPSYPNHTSYDIASYFTNDCLVDEVQTKICIRFLINGYRISENILPIWSEIEKLNEKRETLNPLIFKLLETGYTLRNLMSFLLNDTNYNNDISLKFIEHSLLMKDGDVFSANEIIAREKINELLDYGFNNKSEKVNTLIESLSDIEFYKNFIVEKIISESSDFINYQPAKVSHLVVSSFNQDNANDFKSNFPFLIAVASTGSEMQNHILTGLLTDSIDKDENIDSVSSVIENMRRIKRSDVNLLITHIESYLEHFSENINENIKHKLENLIKINK